MPTFESIITAPNSSWIHRLWPDERRELTAPEWEKLASLEGQVTSHRLPMKWIQIEWCGPNASALTRDCCDDFFFCFQRCCVDNAPFHVTRVVCHRCIVASELAHRRHASAALRLPQPRSRLRTSLLEAHMCRDHSFSTCNLMSHDDAGVFKRIGKKRNPHHGGTSSRHAFFCKVCGIRKTQAIVGHYIVHRS